jgi:hypothetical protein
MKNGIELGMNRSGLATAPRLAPQVLQVPKLTPKTTGDAKVIANERIVYAKEAEPLATMPPPGTLKELASTTVKLLKGQKALVLVDKVAERMAFERGGVRLYEALVSKFDAFGSWEGGPARTELESILRDELRHFHFLAEVLGMLGADATAVTPSADVHEVLATGLRTVLTDPRTDLRSSLEAILQAELADNDCWLTLVRLAVGYGENELAQRFQRCLDEERVHLSRVRVWLTAGLAGEAFGDPRAMHVSEPWLQAASLPMPATRAENGSSPVRRTGQGKASRPANPRGSTAMRNRDSQRRGAGRRGNGRRQ